MDFEETNNASRKREDEGGMRKCPVCGADNKPKAEACIECGQRFQPARVHYRSVGEALGVQPEDREPDYRAHSPYGHEHGSSAPEAGAQAEEERRIAGEQKRMLEQHGEAPPDDDSHFRYLFTPQVVEAPIQPASLGKRTVALVLDWVAVYLVFTFVLYFAGADTVIAAVETVLLEQGLAAFTSPEALPPGLERALWVLTVIMLALLIGLYTAFTAYGGSTPGKALAGIRVTRFDGSEVGWGAALLRSSFLWVFVYLTMGIYLVFAGLYCLIDPYGRSIHDIVAGTRVIRRS